MQLAQLNIAESRYPMSDTRLDGFTGKIDAINALADRADGFIWRLTDDDTDIDGALSLRLPGNDTTLVNMSVWENLKSLYDFIYKTAHAKVMQSNFQNFIPFVKNHYVLWWVEDGHIPNLTEANSRLEAIRKNGPNLSAFNFKDAYGANGAKCSFVPTNKAGTV